MTTIKSFAFWSLAKEFLSAAKAVKDPEDCAKGITNLNLILPAYYLVGHSIELSLKSYLAAKGYTLGDLRSKKYGHNLEALLNEAKKRKLGREVKLSDHQKKAIVLLNGIYSTKRFEYLEYTRYQLPEYRYIYNTATGLLNELARYASNSPFNKVLQRSSR